MRIKFPLALLFLLTGLLFSCQKDDKVPQTDYSIESDSSFELISQHSNGWIKEGRFNNYSFGENVPLNEFEYYSNGYIKLAKIYASYPQQHLYMEVSRSEDNKPLWSKYYTPEGDLWFETEYQNGLPSVKKIYSEKGTALNSYIDGELTSVEFTTAANNGVSTTIYNRIDETTKITIVQDRSTVLEEQYPFIESYGNGVLADNHVPLANPFIDTEESYREIGTSYFSNPIWENSVNPIKYMYPYRNYAEMNYTGNRFATESAVSSDLYQSVIEQYPFTEDEVLVLNYNYIEGSGTYLPPFEERQSLDRTKEENPYLFELKYGNQYVEKIYFGKNIFVVGALRNMPTDENAAKKVKQTAQKYMNGLINGENQLSSEESVILDKVWFELRFFSTLKTHRNGVVIDSTEDYNNAVQEVMDAESSVIQLEYIPFDQMISD